MIKIKNKYYITPKELAEYKDVSIQYIYKLMADKLDKYSTTFNHKKMIDISVFNDYFETEIPSVLLNEILQLNTENQSTFKQKKSTKIQPKEQSENETITDNKTKNDNTEVLNILNKQVENYEKQVEYLKEIIKEKDSQIHTLHELLKASEELQRNNQVLLLQTQKKADTDDLNSAEEYYNNTNEPINNTEEQKPKKGFFSRFFG